MPKNIEAGVTASERALLDLWDLIDATRLQQSEAHAAVLARRAYEAAVRPPKETGMLTTEKEAELKKLLGDIYTQYMALIATKDAETQARGIAYKAAKPQPKELGLDQLLDGVSAALKRTGGR